MSMFNKLSLCVLAVAISSVSYANIIELDALNPDHCRQQLLNSKDYVPVIATYHSDNIGWPSHEFMKKFEILAKQHPERTFFKWDAKKDWAHATQTLCIQVLGFSVQPYIMLVGVINDEN